MRRLSGASFYPLGVPNGHDGTVDGISGIGGFLNPNKVDPNFMGLGEAQRYQGARCLGACLGDASI